MENKDVKNALEKFLAMTCPEFSKMDEKEKCNAFEYLFKYTVYREDTQSKILKSLGIKDNVGTYLKKNGGVVEDAQDKIQEIRNRFYSIKDRVKNKMESAKKELEKAEDDKNEETIKEIKALFPYKFFGCKIDDPIEFDKNDKDSEFNSNERFAEFFMWWVKNINEKDNQLYCEYCGVSEAVTSKAFGENVISSKKRSFSGKLQIDQKDADKGYYDGNCVFACVLCNNAKSDMISYYDFKEYFAPGTKGTKEYWKNIEDKLNK